METLQTIWTALTTENEFLIVLISVPLTFVEGYISMLLFTCLLGINKRKQKILYVILISIFSITCRLFIPQPYNTFLNLIAVFCLIITIFKISILKSIVALLFPIIITTFFETLLAKIYYPLFSIDYYTAFNIPIHRILSASIVYFIMYIIYLLIKYLKINISKLELLDKRKKYLLITNSIFGLLLMCTQLYITAFYISNLPILIALLSIVGLLVYFSISIYTNFTTIKLEATSIDLEEAQLHNKTLEIYRDDTRAFRHDLTNILIGMTGYMDKGDIDGLRKYHSQLLEDIKQTNNLMTLSPDIVNNPAVYNVLASKYHKADSLGIKINLEAFLDLNELHMKIYEFTRVLGILLDNAIEAATECEEKLINIVLRKDNRKHMQLLIIENTYNNKDIDTEKIYKKGYSTKKNNTGLGLWEIRQILKKNNNLNLFTTKNDKFFTQQFEIYY